MFVVEQGSRLFEDGRVRLGVPERVLLSIHFYGGLERDGERGSGFGRLLQFEAQTRLRPWVEL